MPSGFRPINDPRQGARTARGGNADSGGFRVIYDPAQDEAQRKQQQQQPAPKQEEGGWFGRALKRGTGAAIGGVGGLLEELPEAITAGAVNTGLQVASALTGIPLQASRPVSGALGNAAAQEVGRQVGTPYRSFVEPATTAIRSTGQRMVQAGGTPVTQSSDVTNLPGSFSEVPDYLSTVGKFAAERTAESAPTILAGAATTALTRNPTAGRAVLGGLGGAQTYTGIREQQKEAGVTDYSRATTATIASTGLDLISGTGKAVTSIGQGAREGIFKTAYKTAKEEAPTEVAQTFFERYGGYQDLTSREAVDEYIGSFIAGAAGGAFFGGSAGVANKFIKPKAEPGQGDQDVSLIKGKEDTDLGSDVAGGTEADDTITSGTKAAEPVREPQILPTEVVKGLFNEGNVIASLSNTGIAPKYLPALAKRLTSAFQSNNEKELDSILKAQERRLDPAHSSIKSDEDLARNEAVYGAVSQLIGNFREFHNQALQEEELLTGPSEVTKYVGEKLKQEVARAKEAQLRTQQADEILNAQRQEAELQEQQRIAGEAAAREQEIAEAAKRVENIHRQGILQTVVSDPETRDPVKRFTSLLKRNNFDATVSPEEAKALEAATAKLEQRTAGEAAKAGLSVEEYKQNLPVKSLREAENLGMAPEQYMTAKSAADEMGISVPAFVQMQQEQQLARQVVQAQPPAKPPVPFFELQAEREMGPADIAAMEKAQAKRERKAQRDAAKMAEQTVEDREQLSFLTEAAPAPEVVEGKKVVTPAKTGIKQKFDVGKKRAEAFDIAERERRAKALEEARAKAAKAKKAKRPAVPKDKAAEQKTEPKVAPKRPALPKDKVVEQKAEPKPAPKPAPKEKKSAAQKRKKPESGVSQRVRTSEERKAPEAGRGNRPEQGREKSKAVEEKVTVEQKPAELSYEDVLKEAETYLAEDGESGLLKPKEYQQLSLLAEQGKVSPQDLMDRMEAIVTQRSEKAVSGVTLEAPSVNAEAPGKTKAIAEVIAVGRKTGKAVDVLKAIAKQGGFIGRAARRMAKVIGDVDVVIMSRDEFIKWRTARGLADRPQTKTAAGEFYRQDGKVYLVTDMGHERVAVHEMGHAITAFAIDNGTPEGKELDSLYEKYLESASDRDKKRYGFRNTHEFVAEIWSNRLFREYLTNIQYAGTDLLSRFKRIFVRLTGMPLGDVSRVLEISEQIAKREADERATFRGERDLLEAPAEKDVEGAEPLVGGKKSPARQKKIDAFIEGLPTAIGDPVRSLVDNTSGLPTRVAAKYLMLGNTLMSVARNAGIKSVDKFDRLKRDQKAIARRVESQFESWGRSYRELPSEYLGTGKGTVNNMIQRMTDEGKWAFQPDYFRGDYAGKKVEVDTDLGLEFDSMPKNVQDFIKKGFQLSHDLLLDMQQSIVEWASSEYDSLIKQAENDPAKKKKLEQEKAQSLRKYKSMMDINPTTPYAPMQRDGDWVVVAVTDDYRTAEELGDEELLKELESTDKFVDFAYTRGEAARLARSIGGTYKAENIQMFPRDHAAEQYSSGKDLMALFAKLRNSISDSSDLTAPQRKQLDNAVINMQLMALASSSARKGEIKRRKIRSGDLDMVRNIVSRGRSGAQFIASIYKSGEITDALKEMGDEVRQRGGDRELKQTIYNTVLARHLDDITPHAQEGVIDTVTAATSIYMLATNPGFYIQQMAQNPMVVAPILEDKFGAKRTLEAFRKGYAEVAKVLSNLNANDILDLKKLDPKYRAMATYMSEFGALDVGIDKESGRQRTSETGVWSTINNSLRTGTRINEALNRLAASIASYELELEDAKNGKGVVLHDPDAYRAYEDEYLNARHDFEPLTKDGFSAAYNTAKLLDDTHFDYSSTNKPIWMRRGFVGKVAGQFKTFQFGIGALWAKAFHKAISGSGLSLKERIIASRQLALLIGHTALFAGIRGLPMYAVAKGAYYGIMALFGDDDDDPFAKDLDVRVQEWVGDSYLANLLTKGVPTLLGADMSGSIGQGTITSLAPYADTPVDRDTWVKYSAALLGPSASLVGNFLEGANYLTKGETLKAAQRMLPKGLANIAKAEELRQSGATTKKGKAIQEDISDNELFWTILGVNSVEASSRMERQSVKRDMESYYKGKSSELISQMAEAKKSGDQKSAANAVSEWRDLQESRKKQGYDVQPLGNLYKAAYRKLREQRGDMGQRDAGVDQRLDDLYGAPYEEAEAEDEE